MDVPLGRSLAESGPACTPGWTLLDVPYIYDVVAVDPPELGQETRAVGIVGQRRDLDIGCHASHRDGHTENATDAVLQNGPPPLRNVLEEGLRLWEPECDNGTFDADRTAGQD